MSGETEDALRRIVEGVDSEWSELAMRRIRPLMVRVLAAEKERDSLRSALQKTVDALEIVDADNPSFTDCNERKCGECSVCVGRRAARSAREVLGTTDKAKP